ncbi:MAG: NADP-dependent isocitrate dehydrogenase [Acidimicrobiales bacterium]
MSNAKITYTWTDEAPALATLSLLPIVQAFANAADIEIETADISLAGRILANFADLLPEEQRVPDYLAELGELAKRPEANIIKLPNISASVPQLKAAVAELQAEGFDLPEYVDDPETDAEVDARLRYDRVKGSAVNPVLREGNSDRRAPGAVKKYAQKNPHSMGAWPENSASHVVSMNSGDFRSNEQSTTIASAGSLRIELHEADGSVTILKDSVPVQAGEVVDATFMSREALLDFLAEQIDDAAASGVLFSLHLKATMMKISDPIIFGHAVRAFFAPVFEAHGNALDEAGANANNGWGNVLSTLAELPGDQRAAIEAEVAAILDKRPGLAMVNSDKGITNLHVPSDVIVDASMPAMIRASGQMWNAAGDQQDTKAVIPDSSYADLYEETIAFHKEHGAFDPATMGTVPNVGLMAQKAEEYGSHDKTVEIPAAGSVLVVDDSGAVVFEQAVDEGDIWRMCQVKDAPVQDWVRLGVRRARATGWPTIFWLDENRAHDAELIAKVNTYLRELDTDGLDIRIMNVADATRFTLERVKAGENTVSVTGNVLRDYLTDLFPILELGTSAKMLSIVPLMNGGGLFETGAGGSAPKHVQQFVAENHLRWDSLGEFLAIAVSLDHLAEMSGNTRAAVLGEALDAATEKLLVMGKSPSRKVNELDNRGSHFYLALYWADALRVQTADAELAAAMAPLANALADNEDAIVAELNEPQGSAVEMGGYYSPDLAVAGAAMRPSSTLNNILDQFSS